MTEEATESQLQVPGEVPGKTKAKGLRAHGLAKKRATRSPHPGVVLLKPDSRNPTWRARCEDPETGKRVKVRLDPLTSGRTKESRRAWAIARAQEIARRRDAISRGAPRALGAGLALAVERYFHDHPTLRESTRALYRSHANTFLAWADREGITKADDLTKPSLLAFRAARLRVPKHAPKVGDPRQRRETNEKRAPSSVNVELRAIRAILGYLRELGLLARLTTDDLRDGLKRIEAPREAPEFLRAEDLRALLRAALAHDADCFEATRAELKGVLPVGSTPRYQSIAPFVAFVLLTGMRFDEALSLEWEQVDLEALDHTGTPVGEIRLTTRTKTKRPRTVGLEVAPSLRTLLAGMRPEKASGSVFGLTKGEARAAMRRLGRYGAPEWTWQVLRSTCATYLTNSPGIFGSASAYASAKQLGHSVQVAEAHYAGLVRGIPRDATTLEAAMQIGEELDLVVSRVAEG